jgi:hypothetical protein
MKTVWAMALALTVLCSCDLSVFYPKEDEEETGEAAGAAPAGHTPSYAVAVIEGQVKKTTTTVNNTDAMEFLAREVPYLYDDDEAVHHYVSESPPPLINDLFFRAANTTGYYFYIDNSNSFPYSSYSIMDGNTGYDGLSYGASLMHRIFSRNYPPPMEQENLLFNGGTANLTDGLGIITFQSFTPAGMRNEIVHSTETVTGEYRFDDFTLPYNGGYDIPIDKAYDQDVPVTLYTHFTHTPDLATNYLSQTLHYYETLDIHVTEQYESMNRAVYKTVTAFIDSALSVTNIQTSSSVKDFIREGNKITFTLNDYINPMKFEIARITVQDEAAGTAQMKILQLK